MRRFLTLALLMAMVVVAGPAVAQDRVPFGAVLQDANGRLWVMLDKQRYPLPIYPLDAVALDAIPASDQWFVPSSRDGWTLGPQPEWAGGPPAVAATVSPTAPPIATDQRINFEGGRLKNTDPFWLSGGHYKFRWTASGESGRGCFHGAQMMPVERGGYSASAGSGSVGSSATSGETVAYNVPAGSYYLDVGSGCAKWLISIEPLR